MKPLICAAAILLLPGVSVSVTQQTSSQNQSTPNLFPGPDCVLRDKDLKPPKGGIVLGPLSSDGKGGTKGSFAILGGPSLIQVNSLSFSGDGKTLLVGGNAKHLIVWNTKDWSTLRDFPNGPEYVTQIAVSPGTDFVVVGGPKSASLLRLSSGEEVARVGTGFTNFAAFNENGTIILTYTSEGFSVWDSSGKRYCSSSGIGNRSMAISPNGQWLAGGIVHGMNSVNVWKVETALAACGKSHS